jgi:hypothetical protein
MYRENAGTSSQATGTSIHIMIVHNDVPGENTTYIHTRNRRADHLHGQPFFFALLTPSTGSQEPGINRMKGYGRYLKAS